MTTEESRWMRHLLFGAALLLASATTAWAVGDDFGLPKEFVQKFEWQCIEATQNEQMCLCARRRFERLIPASEVRLGHRDRVSIRILEMTPAAVELLQPEIDECIERYPAGESQAPSGGGTRREPRRLPTR